MRAACWIETRRAGRLRWRWPGACAAGSAATSRKRFDLVRRSAPSTACCSRCCALVFDRPGAPRRAGLPGGAGAAHRGVGASSRWWPSACSRGCCARCSRRRALVRAGRAHGLVDRLARRRCCGSSACCRRCWPNSTRSRWPSARTASACAPSSKARCRPGLVLVIALWISSTIEKRILRERRDRPVDAQGGVQRDPRAACCWSACCSRCRRSAST